MSGVPIASLVGKVEKWDPRASSADEEIQYIDLSSVDKDAKSITGVQTVLAHSAPSRARQLVRAGDVLVSTVRPNLNGVAVVPDELDGATASTGFCVLRPRPKKLCGRYLFHWVKTPHFVADMERQATGASYPAVSDKIVKASVLPPHAVDEQKRIAAILDKADAIRRKRKEAIRLTEELLKSVFLEMFGDPVTNPKGWDVKPLGDVVAKGAIVTYGIVQAGPEFAGGVPYIKTGDIKGGEILVEQLCRTSPQIASKFERSRVRTNEIVMCIRASVGAVALVPASIDGANLTQGTARISPGPETTPEYLLHYLRSDGFQHWLSRQVKGATFKEITLKRLREAPICVPAADAQQRFVGVVQRLSKAMAAMEVAASEADDVFNALSQQFFAPDGTSKKVAA